MAPERVLVLGANGFLGQHVVDSLRAAGVEPVAGRRARANVLGLRARRVAMVVADLDDPASLRAAMRGCSTVIHAAGHYPRLSLDREGTLRLGLGQTAAVLRAAEDAGVRRLVYVSSTATVRPAPGRPSDEADTWADPPSVGVYHDLKWAMERLVAGFGGVETRVALPSGCVGPGDLRFGTAGMLVALARGDDPPHADGRVALVDPRDAAAGIVLQALRGDAPARVILSGWEGWLHPLLVALAARYRVPTPSPALAPELAIRLADEAEAAVVTTRVRPSMSRELVDLTLHGAALDPSLSRAVLGVRYRPFAETLDDFDAWARRLGVIPSLPQEAHP